MAKKEEPEAKEKKGKAAPAEEKAESPDKAKKRSGMVIILGIVSLVFFVLVGGGFFAYKTFFAKTAASQDVVGVATVDAHGAPVADAHGAPAADANGTPAADAHGAPAAEAHGAPAAAVQGAPAADAHGAPAAVDAHGAPVAGAEAGKDDAKSKKKKRFGEIYAIPRLEINVGGADLGRGYVRVAVGIEYDGEKDQLDELTQRGSQIKDILINVVSARPKNELLTPKGKEELRKQLLNKINEVTEQPITSLYFTEFLVE